MGLWKSKYPTLDSANKMTKTLNGNVINSKTKYRFVTKRDMEDIARDTNTNDQIRVIISPPFSDFTQVKPNLYMTSIGGMVRENINTNHIKVIISVTHEAPKYWVRGIHFVRIPVERNDPNISIYFDEVSQLISEAIKDNHGVVVHCMSGMSRSATIILAVLMKSFRLTLLDAFNYLKAKRPLVRPANNNFEQLINYEIGLFGGQTVEMVDFLNPNIGIIRIPDVFLNDNDQQIEF